MNSHASAALKLAGRRHATSSRRWITAREFLRNPQDVGSAFPASRYLVDAVLDPVDFSAVRLVVEYGPGSGRFTRALLDRMHGDAQLVAIDVSPRFARHLRKTIPDSRLHARTGSAQMVGSILAKLGFDGADLIVTGIPFSTIKPSVGADIVRASAALLNPQGQMIAYQMRDAVGGLLSGTFARIERDRCWRNLPPCHIYRASRPEL